MIFNLFGKKREDDDSNDNETQEINVSDYMDAVSGLLSFMTRNRDEDDDYFNDDEDED